MVPINQISKSLTIILSNLINFQPENSNEKTCRVEGYKNIGSTLFFVVMDISGDSEADVIGSDNNPVTYRECG